MFLLFRNHRKNLKPQSNNQTSKNPLQNIIQFEDLNLAGLESTESAGTAFSQKGGSKKMCTLKIEVLFP